VPEVVQHAPEVPVWARDDAFPEANSGWGWVNSKGRAFPCESADALSEAIRKDPNGGVCLVWTPERPRMVLPEEIPALAGPIRQARERWVRDDLSDAVGKVRWLGLVTLVLIGWTFLRFFFLAAYVTPQVLERVGIALRETFARPVVGLALLIFVIFAGLPWFQARKRRKELSNWGETGMAAAVPAIRFETWLERQNAPVTKVFIGLIALVGVAQLMPTDGLMAAGLVKPAYFAGEWWRLLTAPFLHGNIVHFLLNASAMAYLGKRLEVFARWPHLPMVFLFAACLGGEASARFVASTSVGASGGLMGWLGFLLVFETLHSRLVPQSSRRRLAFVVALAAFIGALGYRFIDNAAHAGGLIAGMLYAVIVFPASRSPNRPRMTAADWVGGGLTMTVLVLAALYAVWRIAGA